MIIITLTRKFKQLEDKINALASLSGANTANIADLNNTLTAFIGWGEDWIDDLKTADGQIRTRITWMYEIHGSYAYYDLPWE